MNIEAPLALLGGLSPRGFMRRHWQKKPLLIRQAIPGFRPLLSRAALFDLAASEDVESRLVVQGAGRKGASGWTLKCGPLARRALPPLKQAAWTLLVQGANLHDEKVHRLMGQFRFVPDARLDDVMISYATDGGGVGPHFDSYDVFLLQAHGQRRWRIGRQKKMELQENVPLKILQNFEPEDEWVLSPGDMLYLPPRYAHEGVAVGECMTYSMGFRAPAKDELVRELLARLTERADPEATPRLYRDSRQMATENSARVPEALHAFAARAVADALRSPGALAQALGEYLSEPKANVWFESANRAVCQAVELDRRTRMLYDTHHVFINGESFLSRGRDARLMQQLADRRTLAAKEVALLSVGARELLAQWCEHGWVHGAD